MAGVVYSIEFAAAIARLEKNTKAGSRHVKRMADDMEGAARFARNALIALAGAIGVGSFGAAIRSASQAGDAAAKMGDRFGIATEKLIGLQHAGDLAGVSQEAMATGLRTMMKSARDAAQGLEQYERSYKLLNINAAEFINLPMERQFSMIIERLEKTENVTVRNAIAQDLLGRSGGQMLALAAEGSEAMAKAARDAEAWGIAINRVDAAKLELANDAITRVQTALKGIFTTIAVQIAPVIKLIADRFADSAAEAKGFKEEVRTSMEKVAEYLGTGLWMLERLDFAWKGLKFGAALAINGIIQALVGLDRAYTDTMNRIDSSIGKALGMKNVARAVEYSTVLSEMADVSGNRVNELREELQKLALGATSLKDWQKITGDAFKKAAEDAEREAQRIAKARTEFMRGGDVELEKTSEKKEPKDTGRARIEQMIEKLREENMVELELLDEKLREKNLLLDSALEYGLISEEQALAQSALVQKNYEEQKTKIIDDETKRRFGISNVYRKLDLTSASAFFGSMATMMDSSSRTAFKIGQASAISQTIIDTYRAAQGAFASLSSIPFIGPVLGAAAAAAAIIAGMARVRAIKSQQFGGGAASVGVHAASPTTGVPEAPISPLQSTVEPPQQAVQQRRDFNVTVLGRGDAKTTYQEVVDDLVPLFEEAVANGATSMNIEFTS